MGESFESGRVVVVKVDKPIGFDARRIFPYLAGVMRATGLNCRCPDPDERFGLSGEIEIDVPSGWEGNVDELAETARQEISRISQ